MIGIEKSIIERNNELINSFKKEFKTNKQPIVVKFREIIPELKSDSFTHQIHSYPAKLLVHIPYFFLNNSIFSKENDNVLDPFVGTGTVYLESALAGRNPFGADSNPLARLIAKVKITNYDCKRLEFELNNLVDDILNNDCKFLPEVRNCDFWFPKKNIESLSKIIFHINKIEDENIKDFMLVSFSNCVKKVSYADPRVSVPVKLNPERYINSPDLMRKTLNQIDIINKLDVIEKFKLIALDNIERFKKLEKSNLKLKAFNHISTDARKLFENKNKRLEESSIQLIITSPPYAGAQKYIRSSSLNLGWTKLSDIAGLRELDKQNIGRENYVKSEIRITKTGIKEADDLIEKISLISISRANIVCTYINEMKKAIDEMVRVLKKNGHIVLVVGNNNVCNFEFNTQHYFTKYLLKKGLSIEFKLIDDIKSYGLMTKRNKTADIISREYILVFKK